jgi:hypothetical protein
LKKLAYAGFGFVATGLAIGVVVTQHASWWQLVVFAMAPDLALLVGMSRGLERGRSIPEQCLSTTLCIATGRRLSWW